jgi:hypothetical protein
MAHGGLARGARRMRLGEGSEKRETLKRHAIPRSEKSQHSNEFIF